MITHRFRVVFLIFFLVASVMLHAELTLVLESPILDTGMAGLQEALDQAIDDFSLRVDDLSNETLEKPDFLRGSSFATSQSILSTLSIHNGNRPFIAMGSSAAYYSPGLSTSVASEIDGLDVSSDLDAGACIQPFILRGGLPLNFLLNGLSVLATAGYMEVTSGPFEITSLTGSITAQYTLFPPDKGPVAWNGLVLSFGTSFASQKLSITVEANEITQTFQIDPDGSGPLAAFDARVSVEPTIRASIETLVLSCNTGAMTGVTFVNAITLFAGGGLTLGWGRSQITVDSRDPIIISGYLGELVETPGTIGITGTADEYSELFLRPYLAGGIAFNAGAFELSIPVTFKPVDAISVAVFIGVRL